MKNFSCVVGYHTNPYTCGVAKFNSQLAGLLNLDVRNIRGIAGTNCNNALLSIKVSEFSTADLTLLLEFARKTKNYSLFLHGFNDTEVEWFIVQNADKIFCGNVQIYNYVKSTGKARLLFSPATISPQRTAVHESRNTDELRLFTFGMSHKVRVHYYTFLKEVLDETNLNYTISMSTGFHEGESLSDFYDFTLPSFSEMFGERLRFMGMLSDYMILDCLNTYDYFVAFFESGLRENNSSAIASLGAKTTLITNLDEVSPKAFIHNVNCHDINLLKPCDISDIKRQEIRESARILSGDYSWGKLINSLS